MTNNLKVPIAPAHRYNPANNQINDKNHSKNMKQMNFFMFIVLINLTGQE